MKIKKTGPEAIVKHYEACFREHGDSHAGVDWPDQADAAKRYEIMLRPSRGNPFPVIHDYGCGLGHLLGFMRDSSAESNFDYSGSDASKIFVEACRLKFPEIRFDQLSLIEGVYRHKHPGSNYDFIIANGVFTEKRELEHEEMWDYVKATLRYLFARAEVCLSVNFMSTHVDWERSDLFHLPVDALLEFCANNLSRHVDIVSSYGLYEYTAHIYAEPNT